MVHCPACDKPFESMEALRGHLKKAESEGDELHMNIIDVEGWNERSDGKPVKSASDLEPT